MSIDAISDWQEKCLSAKSETFHDNESINLVLLSCVKKQIQKRSNLKQQLSENIKMARK